MLDFWLYVYSLSGVSSRTVVSLRDTFGNSPDIKRVGERLGGDRVHNLEGWRDEGRHITHHLAKMDAGIVPWWSDEYPPLLREIPDFPAFLFYKGLWDRDLFESAVSVVGTRTVSEYGRQCTGAVVSGIARNGISVVSGLAYGVDALSHRTLMDEGNGTSVPVAVLPGGPEGGFPHRNRNIYDSILDRGVAVWEFLPGTPLRPELFAVRNRIVAGLTKCTIVIESPMKGGSMITADLALQYGRDVGACPGSIFSHSSGGSNELIASGAHVIRSGADAISVLQGVGSEGDRQASLSQQKNQRIKEVLQLNDADAMMIQSDVLEGGMSLERLQKMTSLNSSSLRANLTKLEVEGILRLERGMVVNVVTGKR